MNLVYVFGPPAAGKSTLMAELTGGCGRHPMAKPFAHDLLTRSADVVGIELGKRRAAFSGTDALGLNVSPLAKSFLAGQPSALVLGEGDRLAHSGFLDAGVNAGYTVTAVYLTVPDDELDRRAASRGSAQSVSWRTGRATKAARLAEHAVGRHRLVQLDGTAHPAANVARLTELLPALARLPLRVLQ